MLPTKKFSELPVVTGISNSTKVFCIVNGVDSMVTLGTLRDFFGVIDSGDDSGSSGTNSDFIIASSYSELLTFGIGSEYYNEPYIYKRVGTGVLRISVDTEYATPLSTTISGGIVVPTYAQMLVSSTGFEYHDSPYVYKNYITGACRISCDTDFTSPSGTGIATGIVFSTYTGLLSSSLYGYEYHESPYIYKRTESGVFKINCDTDFPIP